MKSYEELYTSIKSLRAKEHETQIELLLTLAEFEQAGYYRDAGYGSLFSFLVEGLSYCKSAASRRMNTARVVKAYPQALDLLREYRVSLTTLSLISGVITPENSSELLSSIADRSRDDVDRIVAVLRSKPISSPKESVKVIKTVKDTTKAISTAELPIFAAPKENKVSKVVPPVEPQNSEQPKVSEEELLYKLSLSVSEDVMAKLKQVQGLLSKSKGKSVSMAEVLGETLDLFLEKKTPEGRNGKRERIAKSQSKVESSKRDTPAQTRNKTLTQKDKDRVLKEADYQCSYVSPEGVRCKETRGLQVDHIIPRVVGGGNDRTNLRCLCQVHNLLAAELALGRNNVRRNFESDVRAT